MIILFKFFCIFVSFHFRAWILRICDASGIVNDEKSEEIKTNKEELTEELTEEDRSRNLHTAYVNNNNKHDDSAVVPEK